MAEFDAISYLTIKGLHGRSASGGKEMVYPCFFDCAEPSDSRKRKLYVNTEEGFFHCKVCNTSGGPVALQRHFGDEAKPGTSDDLFMRRRILDAATISGEECLHNNDDALRYLIVDRGLEVDTILSRKLGFVAGGWSLTGILPIDATPEQLRTTGLVYRDGPKKDKDFFFRHLLIPYISRGHTIQMRGRAYGDQPGGKYMTGPGEEPRLFNADALDGAEEVIITEGEFDCMILDQALKSSPDERVKGIAVVGLPGANAIPGDFDALLSEAKRIFIGFDSDEAGVTAANKLKDRIGQRARLLLLPNKDGRKCDWTEFLLPAEKQDQPNWKAHHPYAGHDWRDVMRLFTGALGKRIFTMAEAGDAFRAYREEHDGIKSGFVDLDDTILPGFLPGQLWVILAKTGAGKTVFLCNLAYQMRQHKILFISLEMTREEVYERMCRIYRHHEIWADDGVIERALSNIYICDENRINNGELEALVDEFVFETGGFPEVMIIDYLGYYARGTRGNSPYEKTTNAVMDLKAIAKTGRFIVISPHQVNRLTKEGEAIDLSAARDSGAVEETADFLSALFRANEAVVQHNNGEQQDQEQWNGHLRHSLLKSRHGGKGRVFALQFDPLTLVIVRHQSRAADKARKHVWSYNNQALTYEEMRAEETKPYQQRWDDQ